MNKNQAEEHESHLLRVMSEIKKLIVEIREKPDDFGDLDNRLYWAIKGIDPHQAICTKHDRKLHKNDFGEFLCGDCIYDIIEQAQKGVSVYDENLWFDPQDKPTIKIRSIKYGNGMFHNCLLWLILKGGKNYGKKE